MIESRIPGGRPILAVLATLMLGACGESTDPLPGKPHTELQQATRKVELSKAALDAAERRIATMSEEQARDRERLAELTASTARLERRNHELGQHLASARSQLTQQARVEKALRQQRDQNVRRVRELVSERQALHASLARASGEIRRLQSRQSPDQRRMASLHYRGAVAAREVEELRRYNGFLLQERGNLQAWLEESNAARRKQQQALHQAEQEVTRIKSVHSAADSINKKLQTDLDNASRELVAVSSSRDALVEEIETLRATATRLAEAERSRSEQLEKALADASSLAEAHDAMAAEIEAGVDAKTDMTMLREELEETRDKLARLRVARDYLVEKVEACASEQQSSSAGTVQLALLDALLRTRIETVSAERAGGRLVTAQWQVAPAPATFASPALMTVATTDADPSKSTRHEKELKETRQQLKDLEREHDTLTKKLEEVETECAAVSEQVQTLTWANKELVKELDAAYAAREAGMSAPLPKGTRGIYVLRQGESLSRVAKAFYGEPDRWKDIVAANKEKIPDPDMVKAGTIILIPE